MGNSILSCDRDTPEVTECTDSQEIRKAIAAHKRRKYWVCLNAGGVKDLVQSIVAFTVEQRGAKCRFGDLVMRESPIERSPLLDGFFGHVIGGRPDYRWLPEEQLREVLMSPPEERRDLIIGGVVDKTHDMLVLVRGNAERITAPLSMFQPSPLSAPDFSQFELDDYGHTLRFGDYEANTESVLWEADREYRKRAKMKEHREAEGFGPSLRRLRKQRQLSQSGFPGVARKTISRIENGEVGKPHGTTLQIIANTLGVKPSEIETY